MINRDGKETERDSVRETGGPREGVTIRKQKGNSTLLSSLGVEL
jgi:hypothetical protein